MRERTQRALHLLLCIAVFISIAALKGAAATGRPAAAQASADPLQADTYQAQFESRVDLVILPVSVLDSNDLPVEGLFSEDLIVVEDGVEQDVAILLSPQDTRLDIALLMDVSNSMRSMEEAAKSSAVQFLDQLSDDDCVLLLRFRETAGPAIWGSPNDPDIRSAINETPLMGGTALRDVIALGFHRLDHDLDRCPASNSPSASNRGAPRSRPAMVVVTDGFDEHSALTFDSLLGIARQSDAPFLPVGFGDITLPTPELRKTQSDSASRLLRGTRSETSLHQREDYLARAARRLAELKELSRATGGQFIRGGNNQEKLNAAYEEVIRWLRSYYLIGYYPGSPDAAHVESELPSWHEVEVRVRRLGHRVRTPAGYYRTPIDIVAARRHVQAGIDLSARGEVNAALVELGLALRADPYSWDAYYHRGGALILAGELNDAQRALLRAAELNPGRGDVHKLASGVSLELGDHQTAWDQAIRAHQAGTDMSEELLLLRQEATAPADLEERLQTPRLCIESFGANDPVDEAALRILHLTLAQGLSEAPEIGLIDLEALADYRILIRLKKLSERSPRQLEADLELWESEAAGGERAFRRGVTLSDIEDRDRVAAELAPHIVEIRARLAGRR